ncbi:hypothetical protein HDU89_001704 [Geranomyces variabilis]|nr:hypothetical protein HDU89_001704 [Geranomyces variabilis]
MSSLNVATRHEVRSNDMLGPKSTEASFMAAELKWFLESQTPPIISEIETIIEELTLKLPHYNRGNAVKVIINSAQPPHLDQLRAAQYYLTLALQSFEKYPISSRDQGGLSKLLERIATATRKAQKTLSRYKEKNGFPGKECDVKSFSPDLPEDLVIEFFVLQSTLMVSVRALNYPQQGIPLQIQSKILGKFRNVKLETYRGRPVEVLDEITVGSASPRLATLIRSLNTIGGLCEDMQNKLRMFK